GMLVVADGILTNLAGGGSYTLLADSTKTLPTIVVKPMESNLYAGLLIVWGCWTAVRTGGTAATSGRATTRMSFIAAAPIILAGILMMFGVLAVRTNDFSHAASRGVAFNYVGTRFAPWAIAVAPFFALPKCWLYGAIGGSLGRRICRIWRIQ